VRRVFVVIISRIERNNNKDLSVSTSLPTGLAVWHDQFEFREDLR
jgi:hypothetical protein